MVENCQTMLYVIYELPFSEDAALADLLIHVRDVSNPDHFSQNQHVLQTLRNLDVPENLIQSMITIGNKSDLVSEGDWNYIRYI